MKKLFVILMAALLACSLVACGKDDKVVLSDDENKLEDELVYKNFVYDVNGEGTYEIKEYKGTEPASLEIPAKIGEVAVTGIGANAFIRSKSIEVIIPNTIEYIGDSAFRDCDKLKSITIPDSVKSIGVGAFYECDALTTVKLSANLKVVEPITFKDCKVLTGIVLPTGLEAIEDAAFWGCAALTEITIPTTVKDMGDAAFYECKGLKKATVLGEALGSAETVGEGEDAEVIEHNIGEIVFKGCHDDLAIEWTEGTVFAEYAKANDYKQYVEPAPAPKK